VITPDLAVSALTAFSKNTQNPDMRTHTNGLYGVTTPLRVFIRRPLMATGTVKFFNAQKGFGFIVQDNGGPDVFVHISAVERAGMHNLNEGQKLSFDVQADQRSGKSAAANLQAV
jgi:CspA family cold shock protein